MSKSLELVHAFYGNSLDDIDELKRPSCVLLRLRGVPPQVDAETTQRLSRGFYREMAALADDGRIFAPIVTRSANGCWAGYSIKGRLERFEMTVPLASPSNELFFRFAPYREWKAHSTHDASPDVLLTAQLLGAHVQLFERVIGTSLNGTVLPANELIDGVPDPKWGATRNLVAMGLQLGETLARQPAPPIHRGPAWGQW